MFFDGKLVYSYVGNPEIFFFAAGDSIYRYHISSKIVDLIFTDEDLVWFYPITAHTILYAKGYTNNDGIMCSTETDDTLAYYYYNKLTDTSEITHDPEYSISLTGYPGDYNVINYRSRATINGKTIPHPSYPSGSVYSGSFGGGTQCHGFGLFIYDYLWGSTSYGRQTRTIAINDWVDTAKAALQLPAGSLIRVDHNMSNQHTMIILSHNSSSIEVYHANWTNGEVRITTMTYSNFTSRYDTINYIKIPSSNCPHSAGPEEYNSTKHVMHCVLCGNNATYYNHFANSVGYGTCLGCGYYGYISVGATKGINIIK